MTYNPTFQCYPEEEGFLLSLFPLFFLTTFTTDLLISDLNIQYIQI